MVKFDFIFICYMGSSDLGLCFYLCVGTFYCGVLYSMLVESVTWTIRRIVYVVEFIILNL